MKLTKPSESNSQQETTIKTQKVPCDLCGSHSFDFLYRKSDHETGLTQDYDIVQCTKCGLAFINPQPLPEETGKLYSEVYYKKRSTPIWIKKYHRRYLYIKDLPGKKILDLGCAQGDFLNYIRRYGYEVAGYEEICSENPYDFPIYSKELHDFIKTKERYDIITAWGVLEHLQRPSRYFELAGRLLKKRGFFVFLVTNIESIASRFLFSEDIPRHMTFFSPATIERYGEKYGFSVEKIYHKNDVYSLPYIDFLNWLLFKRSKKDFTQYDALSFKIKQGQVISKPFLLASRLTGRLARFYEGLAKRNGIITALLQKK